MQTVQARHALFASHLTRPRLLCARQPDRPSENMSSGSQAGTYVKWTGLRSAKRMRLTSADALSGGLVDPIPESKPDAATDLVQRDVDLPNLDRVRASNAAPCC